MIGIDIVEMAGEFCDKDFLFVMHSKQVLGRLQMFRCDRRTNLLRKGN